MLPYLMVFSSFAKNTFQDLELPTEGPHLVLGLVDLGPTLEPHRRCAHSPFFSS